MVTSVDRLSGLDASFLYFETPAHLMHVCGLLVLDPSTMPGPYSFTSLREKLRGRLESNPAFTRKLHNPLLNLDHPVWVDDENFDIEHHVRRIAVASPGGSREVAELCGDIAGQPLDRTRPLWEFWVIEGLADGAIAIMTKMHHATVDGVSGASLVSTLCSLEPESAPLVEPERKTATRRPSDREIAVAGLLGIAKRPVKLVRLLPGTLGVLPAWVQRSLRGEAMAAPFTAPRTSFNGTVTGHRSIAYMRLNLEDVKEVKNTFGTTVNDVVLTLCSGALRKYLDDRDELPDSSLVAMVPVSVHGKTKAGGTNKVSGMFSSLSSDIADPVDRLNAIAEQNRVAKEHHQTLSASLLQDWAQFAAPNTFGLAVRVYSKLRLADHHPVVHNLVISNVPGPPMPIYFVGARIVGFYPFGPVFHGAGLNITVLSNDGHLDVGLIACRELAPDLWDLAEDLPIALAELVSAARAAKRPAPTPRRRRPAQQA
ncbi:MAG TPA: wax ester/triacylglycerol synthase family O-acyltransferase [Jatrophihabitantaceae bacterium]|nr:wax ester/triacylglycerol synthase family O-acyltransferase [Jatrophihabitantaceae bacterium]